MVSSAVTVFIALGLSSNLLLSTQANEFLKPMNHAFSELVSEEEIRTSLLDEVEGSLGTGSASRRLAEMEAALGGIIAALPKNKHGNLGHSAVRYALHRLFVLRHGWVIQGLDAQGETFNASSPAGVLANHVPAYIEGLFEKRLAGKGFGLHETAVLAATIEHLIHDEATSRLGSTFNVYDLPVIGDISQADATRVLETYMMAYILGEQTDNMTSKVATDLVSSMPDIFLAWHDTMEFVNGVQTSVTKNVDRMDFAVLAKVVQQVGEEYGSFQDKECRQLKDKLVSIEDRGTGRVKLSDFYSPALGGDHGAWQFQESASYLRQLGALHEADPKQPSVMIANYINAQSNCIATSGYYAVCCKDECENLLGHVEQNIGASEAKPVAIAALIGKLPSSTVAAPHEVSSTLLQRLEEIAATHGGVVPLHGRLFAQWMHHVYPRECSYPHMSGTTRPVNAEQWMSENDADATASEDEMRLVVSQEAARSSRPEEPDQSVELMPWSPEEELFVYRTHHEEVLPATRPAAVRSAALLAAAGSLAFAATRMLNTQMTVLGSVGDSKCCI